MHYYLASTKQWNVWTSSIEERGTPRFSTAPHALCDVYQGAFNKVKHFVTLMMLLLSKAHSIERLWTTNLGFQLSAIDEIEDESSRSPLNLIGYF